MDAAVRVGVLHFVSEPHHLDPQSSLLQTFSHCTGFERFTGKALAAGEFAITGQRSVRAASPDQVAAVMGDKGDSNRCDHCFF